MPLDWVLAVAWLRRGPGVAPRQDHPQTYVGHHFDVGRGRSPRPEVFQKVDLT